MKNFIMRAYSICSLVALLLGLCVDQGISQVSITSFGTAYTENFNTLALSGTSSTVPTGWAFAESGTNANTLYNSGSGTNTAGDTYSFGAAASTDRAFGGLLSGSLNPILGGSFQNNTGSTITSLAFDYTGEQWRLGTSGRTDRLDFQYSTDATSLTTGTWTDVDNLDFLAPNSVGTVGALDGNLLANSVGISFTVGSLTIANGATIWIRWNDFNASGADDGLGVDNFSIVACAPVSCPANLTVCSGDAAFALSGGLPIGGTYTGVGVTANMFNPSMAAIGVNVITYTFDDMMGCAGTCMFNITVNATPIVTCPADLTVCETDAPIALSGENPTGGDFSGPGITGSTFDPAEAGPGVHSITYDFFGTCDGFCTFNITVTAEPTVTCPLDITVCNDAAAFALTGGSPGGGVYSGTGVVGVNFDPAVANLGVNVITYTYSSGGCTDFCVFNITVVTSVTVTCPVDITVCSSLAPFALTGGSPAGGTYTGTGVVGANFDPSIAALGVNVITYTFASGTCMGSCNFNITVNAGPTAIAGSYGPLCETDPNITLTGTPIGGVWTGIGITGGNMFDPTAGTQTLTYTVTSGGCTDSDQTTIVVNPCVAGADFRWIVLDEGESNGGCISNSDCENNTICLALQYTPGASGNLAGYTSGFYVPCDGLASQVISSTTCLPMTNNSPILNDCAGNGVVLMNASANTPTMTIPVTAGVPMIIHQACFTVPNDGTLNIDEVLLLDITTTILTPDAVTDFPAYIQYTLDSVVVCGLLPLRFLDFTAQKYADLQSQLDWTTADEINNDYFDVQRSVDGGKTFKSIGRVEATTEQRAINVYSFIDRNAKPGKNYYRLRQFDIDGRFQYSPVRSVVFEANDKFSVKAWPNPVSDRLNIDINNAQAEGEIRLIDFASRLVTETTFDKGITENEIDVEGLAAGVYTLIITTGGEKHVEKIVVID